MHAPNIRTCTFVYVYIYIYIFMYIYIYIIRGATLTWNPLYKTQQAKPTASATSNHPPQKASSKKKFKVVPSARSKQQQVANPLTTVAQKQDC